MVSKKNGGAPLSGLTGFFRSLGFRLACSTLGLITIVVPLVAYGPVLFLGVMGAPSGPFNLAIDDINAQKSGLRTRVIHWGMKDTAHEYDDEARGLAADYKRTEGLLLDLLMEMRKENVFPILIYSGIFDYCERALKLSRSQAYYFKSVAEKSEEIPEIKQAIVEGELTLSQARRIVTVVTPENKDEWIEKAKVLPQRELERAVTTVNPKAHVQEKLKPIAKELSELRVLVDEKTEAKLNALREILAQKRGKGVSLGEVVAWAVEVTSEKCDPVRRAVRAMNRKSKEPSVSSRKSESSLPRLIPAAVRNPVMVRDNMQCAYTSADGRRCQQKRWLDFHHLRPFSEGGPHAIDNLVLLCRGHHQLWHAAGKRNLLPKISVRAI